MAKILIKNGNMWNGETFSPNMDILTNNKKIEAISTCIEEPADFIYNANGKIVSAGLVDTHIHMRGISSEQFGIQAEMACFPFGVTAAAEASGIYGDKNLLDSFMLKSCVFVYAEFKNNKAYLDNAQKMLEKYQEKAIGVKVCFDTNIYDVSSIEPLKEVCHFAHSNNLIVMVHCSNSPVKMSEIINTLDKGDILTHAYHGGINNASEDNFESIKNGKQCGVIIDAGLAGNVHTDFEIFKNAINNGAEPDTISTDITRCSAYKRGGRYGMTMCMNIAKSLGMSEKNIFRSITSSPAKVLSKEDEWGYLKVGRCADISVFDYTDESFDLTDRSGNHISAQSGYRCVLTVSDGEIVYRE